MKPKQGHNEFEQYLNYELINHLLNEPQGTMEQQVMWSNGESAAFVHVTGLINGDGIIDLPDLE